MKKASEPFIFFAMTILASFTARPQTAAIDSLRASLVTQKKDTDKVNSQIELAKEFTAANMFDSAMKLANDAIILSQSVKFIKGEASAHLMAGAVYSLENQFENARQQYRAALKLSEELNDKKILGRCYSRIGDTYRMEDNYPKAFENYYAALKKYEEIKDSLVIGNMLTVIGGTTADYGNNEEGLKISLEGLRLNEKLNNKYALAFSCNTIGWILIDLTRFTEASVYIERLETLAKDLKNEDWLASSQMSFGKLRLKEGEKLLREQGLMPAKEKLKLAEQNCLSGLAIFRKLHDELGEVNSTILLGQIYFYLGSYSRATKYFNECLQLAGKMGDKFEIRDGYQWLSKTDSAIGNHRKALESYKKYVVYRDSMISDENTRKNTQLKLQYEFDKKNTIAKAEQEKKDAQAKRTRNIQYTAIGVALLVAAFLYWNNRQKQKAKTKIEKAYSELKATQQQLIQSEKMASLGELTAGIAHEIQNPLNFVNNFSDVNKELLEELKEEADKGNLDEIKAIANDVINNEEKINHHGKRADAIVKGMLQHSRTSSGQREPTDINALCDEYLRLAYHGYRAKDNSFNATMKTAFDKNISNINIIPQDIGRVILNLINNAFYAVNERQKTEGIGYEPTVTVSTKKLNDKVEIKVKDNGKGIPQKIADKIFQPFFTTKPTGQGTGLGLSLAYDIVKAHGGEIKVQSKDGEGSEFIIQLPTISSVP